MERRPSICACPRSGFVSEFSAIFNGVATSPVSNTALVVLNGVGNVSWSNDDQVRRHHWHAQYGDWEPTRSASVGPPFPRWNTLADDTWALGTIDTRVKASGSTSLPESAAGRELPNYVLQLGRLSVSGLTARLYKGISRD